MADIYSEKQKPAKEKSLQNSVDNLTRTMNEMITILKNAEKEVLKESLEEGKISEKLERMIEQNKDIAKALILLLEVSREHLPRIAAYTMESSRLMRRPAQPMPRPEPRPRPSMQMQMPLPPEPRISGTGLFPNIPEPPAQEQKKKKGLFGFGK